MSAAISIDGKVVWTSVMGYADLKDRISATRDSQYRIGSSSEAVNATLAALLVAEGRLNIDAPITRYIDYFPDKGHGITTRQLLSHTAGIRHYGTCFCAPNTHHFDSVHQAIDTFSASPLLFAPGTGFSYSSYGTVLSSGVMEGAGGGNGGVQSSAGPERSAGRYGRTRAHSRDLHDIVGHSFSSIVLKSDLASRIIDLESARTKSELDDINAVGRDALQEIRLAIHGLNQSTLMAATGHVRALLEAADIALSFSNSAGTLPPAVEHAVAMVMREAITNVVCHASAMACTVDIRKKREICAWRSMTTGMAALLPRVMG